jgi:hypothetical protein
MIYLVNSMYTGQMDNMEQKECRKCKQVKSLDLFYPRPNRLDGKDSYCKECVKLGSIESFLKNQKKWFHQDGYSSEKEHFNAAIKQYAEVFNLPSLTRHLKK